MASKVILYVGPGDRLDPTTQVIDATAALAPNGGTYELTTLVPGVVYNVWVELSVPGKPKSTLHLGTTRVEDTVPPQIALPQMALSSTKPATSISLSWKVTDNYALESVYVLLSSTQTTVPGAALVKSAGVRINPPLTSTTISGLLPLTAYYGWIMARDTSGNESAVVGFAPAPLTTSADTTAPQVGPFSLIRSTLKPETELVLQVTVQDVV